MEVVPPVRSSLWGILRLLAKLCVLVSGGEGGGVGATCLALHSCLRPAGPC